MVGVLPGVPISTGMWFNPNSRGSRLRIWQPWGCKSLHAHQPSLAAQRERGCRAEARSAEAGSTLHYGASARRAISRRLASVGTADPGDLKSPSLPGASPGSPTNLRSSSCGSASRRVVNREQQTGSTQDRAALGVQVSPRRPIIQRKEELSMMPAVPASGPIDTLAPAKPGTLRSPSRRTGAAMYM
jgi:hypothetical protein